MIDEKLIKEMHALAPYEQMHALHTLKKVIIARAYMNDENGWLVVGGFPDFGIEGFQNATDMRALLHMHVYENTCQKVKR